MYFNYHLVAEDAETALAKSIESLRSRGSSTGIGMES
jgi:hypothetical protein